MNSEQPTRMKLEEAKIIVRSKYPDAKMQYREHQSKNRYRVWSEVQGKRLSGWRMGESLAWRKAADKVLHILEKEDKDDQRQAIG